MIVVADALFTVFTIMMSCTKESKKNLYKYLHKKKKQMSALKNETEEDIQLSKNPSRDKVKRGRSNGTKLWEKHIKDTCSNITPTPNSL